MSEDLRIEMTDHGLGKVFIDGREVKHIRFASFCAKADGINLCRLELIPKTAVIIGPCEVETDIIDLEAGAGIGLGPWLAWQERRQAGRGAEKSEAFAPETERALFCA